MINKRSCIFLVLLFISGALLMHADDSSQSSGADSLLNAGIRSYQESRYEVAANNFYDIISNNEYSARHADGYFWSAKTAMALGQLDTAVTYMEYFIHNYPRHPQIVEAQYQRGRILYLQGEFEQAIQSLAGFIESNPDSPFVANALYWSGEALINLGHYDDALVLFNRIVHEYPTSYRLEPARYRIAVLQLQQRETVMLELLRSSHQELLYTIEYYQLREQELQESIADYRQRLLDSAPEGFQREILTLQRSVDALQAENAELQQKISQLQDALLAQEQQET